MGLDQEENPAEYLLLILAEFQGIIFLVFRKFVRRSSLLDRPDNYNHYHQIIHSEKMLSTASRWNGKGNYIFYCNFYYALLSFKLCYLIV